MSTNTAPLANPESGNPRFRFDDILDEIDGFVVTATPFLDKTGPGVLNQLRERLQGIRASAPGQLQWWGIKDRMPLVTVPNQGEHERDRTAPDSIMARITSKWGITVVQARHGVRPRELFEVVSSASVLVDLLDCNNYDQTGANKRIWCWRFELGDSRHPGCFFHTQLGSNVAPVPGAQDVSVPRLPAVAFTPVAAMDFVLGELFQARWAEAAGRDTEDVNRWSRVHTKFLSALLEWKLNRVRQRAIGSPWLWLKRHKPKNDLFTVKRR